MPSRPKTALCAFPSGRTAASCAFVCWMRAPAFHPKPCAWGRSPSIPAMPRAARRRAYGPGPCIADEAARLHGGRLVLSNRPQGGACAELFLPLARALGPCIASAGCFGRGRAEGHSCQRRAFPHRNTLFSSQCAHIKGAGAFCRDRAGSLPRQREASGTAAVYFLLRPQRAPRLCSAKYPRAAGKQPPARGRRQALSLPPHTQTPPFSGACAFAPAGPDTKSGKAPMASLTAAMGA